MSTSDATLSEWTCFSIFSPYFFLFFSLHPFPFLSFKRLFYSYSYLLFRKLSSLHCPCILFYSQEFLCDNKDSFEKRFCIKQGKKRKKPGRGGKPVVQSVSQSVSQKWPERGVSVCVRVAPFTILININNNNCSKHFGQDQIRCQYTISNRNVPTESLCSVV